METKLEELYWTTEAISNEWDRGDYDRKEDANGIAKKFRWIMLEKIKLSKEQIGWFKVAQNGNQIHYVFKRNANVPRLLDKLFRIFEKENKDELVSKNNENTVVCILTEILPIIYEEETELSPDEEIQECIILINRMKQYQIFQNKKNRDLFNLIEDIDYLMTEMKKEIEVKEKRELVQKERRSNYELRNENLAKKFQIERKVKEFFATEKQKKYVEKKIIEKIEELNDLQKCYKLVSQWCNKWSAIVEQVNWFREAENFYNMYELFQVHKKLKKNIIADSVKAKCYKEGNWSACDELKEYERLFCKIGVKDMCHALDTKIVEEEQIVKINNKKACITKCVNKVEELYQNCLCNLSMDDRLQIRVLMLDELEKEDEDCVIGVQRQENLNSEFEQEDLEHQESLHDILYDIRHFNKADKDAMIKKYLYVKTGRKRGEMELQRDLEYIYSIKEAEGETILKYLPYREFINI